MWDLYVRKDSSFCYKFSYKTEDEARAEANKLFANGTCRQCYIMNSKTKEHAYLLKGE